MTIADYLHAPISCAAGEDRRDPARSARDWVTLISATIAVGMVAFAVNVDIALRFDELGVFRQYDVLFDTDPKPTMRALERETLHGKRARSPHDFAHLNQILYLQPFIRYGGDLLTWGENDPSKTKKIRHQLVVLSSPVLSALTAMCTLWIFVGLSLSLVHALLLTLLGCVSFTQLIFFSMPESFSLSGMFLAATFLLAVRSGSHGSRRWQWILATVFVTGVTITNVVAVAMLFGLMRLFAGEKLHLAALDTTVVVGSGAIATLLVAAAFGNVEPVDKIKSNGTRFVTRWSVSEPIYSRAAGFPTALVNAVVAPKPTEVENLRAERQEAKHRFMLSMRESPSAFSLARIPDLSVLALFAAGLWGCWRGSHAIRYVGVASAAIIGFNWALHSVWGVEFFLYSQHWQISFLIPLAGLFFYSPRSQRYWTAALTLSLLFVIARNRIAMDVIWTSLGS